MQNLKWLQVSPIATVNVPTQMEILSWCIWSLLTNGHWLFRRQLFHSRGSHQSPSIGPVFSDSSVRCQSLHHIVYLGIDHWSPCPIVEFVTDRSIPGVYCSIPDSIQPISHVYVCIDHQIPTDGNSSQLKTFISFWIMNGKGNGDSDSGGKGDFK